MCCSILEPMAAGDGCATGEEKIMSHETDATDATDATGETEDMVARVLGALEDHGLLLLTDARLPSLTTIVAGGPVRGSWLAHPCGHTIYAVATHVEAHADVTDARLISGKVTYIHRRLWPALLGVATAREPWQTRELPLLAAALLEVVAREGVARTDDLHEYGWTSTKTLGEAARELERRLLVRGESIHTERGSHAKRLETWERWAARIGFAVAPVPADAGRAALEATLVALTHACNGHDSPGRLPWMERGMRRGAAS